MFNKILRFMLPLALLLTGVLVSAKLVGVIPFSNGGKVLLANTQGNCPTGMLEGEYHYPNNGKKIKGCWAFHPNGMIFFRDEEGDGGLLDPGKVQPLTEI